MRTLAWHETLELHELVAFQSIGLMTLKKGIKNVKDQELRKLYGFAIGGIENNLKELLRFYPYMPVEGQTRAEDETAFYAGSLLGLAKTTVRNYAIAITETATPELKKVLVNQLNQAIKLHTMVFDYMYKNGYYPSYDLKKLAQNDVRMANKALSMRDEEEEE
ncbi:MAG TPA: spore coat protein [Chondromyces sp.]|nr:spore coat protein [Chondromyces sp.]